MRKLKLDQAKVVFNIAPNSVLHGGYAVCRHAVVQPRDLEFNTHVVVKQK